MANVETTIANGSTYKSIEVPVKGNTFLFMQVSGKSNYVSITKLTNNPFVTAGRMFESWEQAETKYTSADMHIAIFSAKSIFTA
jgi:hypothetical protein